jgi:hypothetical protein
MFCGGVTTRIRSSRAAYSARIAPLWSGDRSSTAMISKSSNDWSSSESRHCRRYPCTR